MALALFDLDNTLIDRNGAFRRWSIEFAGRHGLADDALEWMWAADGDGFTPREELLAAVIDRFGLPVDPADLHRRYQDRMAALIAIRPEVLAGLDRLRADGWRVGIVTNGDAGHQLAKIEQVGLPAHVDGWAISGAEGVRKPDPALFGVAAARCGGALADGGWMVGDSRPADIAGGHAAGLRTAWIPGYGEQTGGPEPDHTVPDVLAAFPVIAAGRGGG